MKIKYLFVILVVLITIGVVGFFIFIYHPEYSIVLRKVEEIGIEEYNMKFNKFEKQDVLMPLARNLIERVAENNMYWENEIKIEYIPISGNIIETANANHLLNDIVEKMENKNKYIYYIEITGYTSEGVINAIKIEEIEDT